MYRYYGTVIRVIDGDTCDTEIFLGFDVSIKQRLRLFGVDTPETRTRDLKEKKKGLAAKEFVKKRIEGKKVIIDVTKGTGKYGRYLATIFYGDYQKDLNKELVRKRHAKKYLGGKR